ADGALAGDAAQAECLGQHGVEGFAAAGPAAQLLAALEDFLVGELGEFGFPVADAANLQCAVSEPPLRRGAEPRLDVVEPTLAKTIGTVGAVGLRRRGRCAGNNGDVVQGSSLRWQELGERRGVSPTWGPRYARRAYA